MASISLKKLLKEILTRNIELVGEVRMFSGIEIPSGWHICDGSAVSRTQYKALFDAIGTTYGAGDGAVTFNLPDLRDRFPMGIDGVNKTLNLKGGYTSKVLLNHNHSVPAANTGGMSAASTHNHYLRGIATKTNKGSNYARPRSINHTSEETAYTGETVYTNHNHGTFPAHNTSTTGTNGY